MKSTLILYPAYGRVYKTKEAAKADWEAGKDFSASTRGGPYTSIRDAKTHLRDFSHVVLVLPQLIGVNVEVPL